MSERLQGKKIVVTAAGQGIGKATAIAFHNEGAKVYATDINEKTLKTLKEEYSEIEIYNLDSTNKTAVEKNNHQEVVVLLNKISYDSDKITIN